MGEWKLLTVEATCSDFETNELFGTNFKATFRLKYTPTLVGKFKEAPLLDWHETIMMNEHHKREHWVFDTNMYAHNPCSKTLEIWPKRYVQAYESFFGRAFLGKGYAKLFDRNGLALRPDALPRNLQSNEAKADAVRSYLKSKGGVLEIQVHDIPSINKPKNGDDTHKERLLLFNVGVEGGGPRCKAYQYLVVDSATAPDQWTRRAGLGWTVSGLKTTGMQEVPPPAQVSMRREGLFFPGEYM